MKKAGFVLFVAWMLILVIVAPTFASTPMEVRGTLPVEEVYSITFKDKGSNCFINIDGVLGFRDEHGGNSAVIDGQGMIEWVIISKGPCDGTFPGSSDETWTGKGTFEGTVNGIPGRFDFNYNGTVREGGQFSAKLNIGKGYGGLANLHGVLTDSGDVLGEQGYSGRIHFD